MAKKAVKKASKEPVISSSFNAYLYGVLSIVTALLSPLVGFVIGIIGLVVSKKEKTPLSEKGRKLSIIGLVIGAVLLIIQLILTMISLQGITTGLM